MLLFDAQVRLGDKPIDVVTMGEAVVDMISDDYVSSLKTAVSFKRFFGGSSANIAVNISDLGFKTAVIAGIGTDPLGDFILERLSERGVLTGGVSIVKEHPTSVVLVSKSLDNPAFLPLRGADRHVNLTRRHLELVSQAKVFFFSAWALSSPAVRETTLRLLLHAKKEGCFIAFDPNYREEIWDGETDGREMIKEILPYVDVVKPSASDAWHIFATRGEEDMVGPFLRGGASLVVATLGSRGLIASDGKNTLKVPVFTREVKDTTGAGDAFWSGFLASLVAEKKVADALKIGSYASAYSLSHVGATCRMPGLLALEKDYGGG